jgi:dihydroorotate dehydrogenase
MSEAEPSGRGRPEGGRPAPACGRDARTGILYRLLFRLLLRRMEPERAHALTERTLARIPARLVRRALGRPDPVLRVRAFGRELPSPLGVAAGIDKDAGWFEGLAALGFGFVEVGTITALPQAGNPRPRVFRLTEDRALLNSMGFPNPGAEAAARRLADRDTGTVVGINVGRSKLAEDAEADYRESVQLLAPLADYLVLNVSSPNTPGLRALQAVEPLGALIDAVRAVAPSTPLLVKVAPDLSDAELDAIADLAVGRGIEGIVAVNTTISRAGLRAPLDRPGGVSGAPLKARALEVLQRLRARAGDRLLLVSVGGIETADDAWERIRAGATLVQAYTGFVYGGPLWPRRLNRELARRARAASAASIQDLVGSAAPAGELS